MYNSLTFRPALSWRWPALDAYIWYIDHDISMTRVHLYHLSIRIHCNRYFGSGSCQILPWASPASCCQALFEQLLAASFHSRATKNPSDQTGLSETGWRPLRGTPTRHVGGDQTYVQPGNNEHESFFVLVILFRRLFQLFPSVVLSDYLECYSCYSCYSTSSYQRIPALHVRGTSAPNTLKTSESLHVMVKLLKTLE